MQRAEPYQSRLGNRVLLLIINFKRNIVTQGNLMNLIDLAKSIRADNYLAHAKLSSGRLPHGHLVEINVA